MVVAIIPPVRVGRKSDAAVNADTIFLIIIIFVVNVLVVGCLFTLRYNASRSIQSSKKGMKGLIFA
jgi:hypothetical protein